MKQYPVCLRCHKIIKKPDDVVTLEGKNGVATLQVFMHKTCFEKEYDINLTGEAKRDN